MKTDFFLILKSYENIEFFQNFFNLKFFENFEISK